MLYTILSPVGEYLKSENGQIQPVSLLADPKYARAWPGGVGDRKMGSNYAPTIYVQQEAASKGLHHVLWLYGPEHELTEAGIMNIFMLFINDKGGKATSNAVSVNIQNKRDFISLERELITPPLNGLILPGVNRISILELAKQWDEFKVTEDRITMAQVIQLLKEDRVSKRF